jgi:uncharacterized protein YcaQ
MTTVSATISQQTHRRFILGKQGLWPGRRWAGKEGTAQALCGIEAVQMDPVSVVAQSHDIVLWGRVLDYRPEYLQSVCYEDRQFFDYGGALYIYPMTELPYWRVAMERHKHGGRWADFAAANPAVVDKVKQELRERGPLRKRDVAGSKVDAYRAGKDSGLALHSLWLAGELMTHHRLGKERVYDFLENVAPDHLHHSATVAESESFFAIKTIALSGLVTQRSFRNGWRGLIGRAVDVAESRAKLAVLNDTGRVTAIQVEGEKEAGYVLTTDIPILETLQSNQIPAEWLPLQATTEEEVTFLSPLDYVSARKRAAGLFGFDYIWEIYKPADTRKYGPYTLPILYGDRLVARMDVRLDRKNKTLHINGFWPEAWFEPDDAFGAAFRKSRARFATFLGAEDVNSTFGRMWGQAATMATDTHPFGRVHPPHSG